MATPSSASAVCRCPRAAKDVAVQGSQLLLVELPWLQAASAGSETRTWISQYAMREIWPDTRQIKVAADSCKDRRSALLDKVKGLTSPLS